jgi:tape measure domain-containing protein
MPNTAISYSLDARSSLAATIKADSDAMRDLTTSADRTYKELVSGMNAATRAAKEMRQETAQLDSSTRAGGASTQGLFATLAGGVTVGTLAATAIQKVAGAALDMGKSAISAAGDFEQAKISFTTFLGSAPAMKSFFADLQSFANVSPFEFTDLEKDSQFLLAMGTAGKDVLPVLKDVSAAVAAAGGGADQLQSVTAAYAKINAEGKTSAIYLNELTRDGVPAWNMLAESMGKSVAQVRELATNGEITAAMFDKAFHAYTVEHYNGMLEQQSRTLKGLASTIEDVGGQFARALGGPVIAAIEPELAKLTDQLTSPGVTATLAIWGENIGKIATAATKAWDVFAQGARTALSVAQPLFDAIGALIGSLPDGAKAPDPVAGPARSAGLLAQNTADAGAAADTYKTQIEAAQDVLTQMQRGQQARNYVLDEQIAGERTRLSLLEQQWQVQDRATSVARLQQKIDRDTALAKNLYSQPGMAAGSRLQDERLQLQDMLTAQSREGEKTRAQNHIAGLEAGKKAEDRAATLRQQAQQDEIERLRKASATAKTAADDAAKAQAAWTAQTKATTDEYRQLYEHVGSGAPVLTAHKGILDQLNEKLRENPILQSAVNDTLRAFVGLTQAAPAILGKMGDAVDQLAQTLGIKDGLAGVVRTVQDGVKGFLDLLMLGAPAAIIKFTGDLAGIGDNLKLIADGAKIAQLSLQITGGDFNQSQNLLNAYAQFDTDRKAADKNSAASNKAYQDSLITAARRFGAQQGIGPQAPIVKSPDITSGGSIPHRAGGGPVSQGGVYLVGENGPEIFQPRHDGAIVPMGGGGGGDLTVHIEALCPDCHQRRIEQTIRWQGADLLGAAMRGSRHI